jgi:hypothetical protein
MVQWGGICPGGIDVFCPSVPVCPPGWRLPNQNHTRHTYLLYHPIHNDRSWSVRYDPAYSKVYESAPTQVLCDGGVPDANKQPHISSYDPDDQLGQGFQIYWGAPNGGLPYYYEIWDSVTPCGYKLAYWGTAYSLERRAVSSYSHLTIPAFGRPVRCVKGY